MTMWAPHTAPPFESTVRLAVRSETVDNMLTNSLTWSTLMWLQGSGFYKPGQSIDTMF